MTKSPMQVPGLGQVSEPDESGWRYSQPRPLAVLHGSVCRLVLEGYDDDPRKEDFHTAIKNFLHAGVGVLEAAAPHIHQYYEDCNSDWEPDDDEYLVIDTPEEVWEHISFGEPTVSRRPYGDKAVYVSIECECDWEPEHGLQLVFKNGLRVNKVGPYDGHLTNSDAYDDERLEDVVYSSR